MHTRQQVAPRSSDRGRGSVAYLSGAGVARAHPWGSDGSSSETPRVYKTSGITLLIAILLPNYATCRAQQVRKHKTGAGTQSGGQAAKRQRSGEPQARRSARRHRSAEARWGPHHGSGSSGGRTATRGERQWQPMHPKRIGRGRSNQCAMA